MKKIMIAGLLWLVQSGLVAHAEMFAYVTHADTPGSISLCTLDSKSGQFKTCEMILQNELSAPLDIAIQRFGSTHYAFISNSAYPALITRCQLGEKGALSQCELTDVPSYAGVAFHESDALYAYVTLGLSINKCKVNELGQISSQYCEDSGAGPIFTNGAVYTHFKTFNQIDYVYIANGDWQHNASILQCQVAKNGDLSHCIDAGPGPNLKGAADIDFATLDEKTYAYITESGGSITQCFVNPKTGLFHNCIQSGAPFHTPLGMTLKNIAGTLYAYIVDSGFSPSAVNKVRQCTVHSSGNLECADSGVGDIFVHSFGLFIR